MGIYIKPFKGRNSSLASDVNFLWHDSNIYIMDNHRCAYWCWMQLFNADNCHSLLHIDKHYDTRIIDNGNNEYTNFIRNIQPVNNLSIEQYLDIKFKNTTAICWDNYLSIFLDKYHAVLDDKYFATYGCGDKPQEMVNSKIIGSDNLHEVVRTEVIKGESKWIINIDLDYFFYFTAGVYKQSKSDEYIDELFSLISCANKNGKVESLTICLSPECCGGWQNAEAICKIACQSLGINFQLTP